MKYFPLVWAGIWRKPLRTTLTFLAIIAAFLLFGGLQGIDAVFGHLLTISRLDRVYVMSRLNNGGDVALPISHVARIRATSGVASVTPINGLAGYYRDPKEFIFTWAVDPETFFDAFPELHIPPDQLQTWRQNRGSVVIGSALAAKYGWKIGDRVPLIAGQRRDGSKEWAFDVVGIFDEPESGSLTNLSMRMLLHYAYMDEARIDQQGTANLLAVRVSDPTGASALATVIDKQFANSTDETESSSEKDYAADLLSQLDNVQHFLDNLTVAVFFTLLFLTGNSVAQSIRERTGELAVLKAMGFSNRTVQVMLVAETLILCLTGAMLGLVVVWIVFPQLSFINGGGKVALQPSVVALGMLAAIVLAFAVTIVPVRRIARMTIVDAMADR